MEIAALMLDIGKNVGMEYTADGSSAKSENARNALVNNYAYSATATYSPYDHSTVKQEIQMSNRPVYMRGCHSSKTTGTWFWKKTTFSDCHAWVCNGYKEQYDVYIHNEGTVYEYTQQENRFDWLHMNWGWTGRGNAWFFKNLIKVYDVTISVDENSVNPNFEYDRKCIYRIKP